MWRQALSVSVVPGGDLLRREGRCAIPVLQTAVMCPNALSHALGELFGIGHIPGAQIDAGRLVGIGRANAPLRCPDSVPAAGCFQRAVERTVTGQDDVCSGAQLQPWRTYVHTQRSQLVHLRHQLLGVNDHARANETGDARMENARRHQMQPECKTLCDDRVTGVVTAVETGYKLGVTRQPVHHPALPLVTPLSSHHDDCGHRTSSCHKDRRCGRTSTAFPINLTREWSRCQLQLTLSTPVSSTSSSSIFPVTVKTTRSQILITRSAARSRLWAAHNK